MTIGPRFNTLGTVNRPDMALRVTAAKPQQILKDADVLPIAQRFKALVVDDGKLSRGDVDSLIRSISARKLTPQGEKEVREAVARHRDAFSPEAASRIKTFLSGEIPRLRVTGTQVLPPGAEQASPHRSAVTMWNPPTTYANGTPLTDLAGYRMLMGTAPGVYTRAIDIRDPTATGYVVDNLDAGTWYFSVRAYNAAGVESPNSNEASKVIE